MSKIHKTAIVEDGAVVHHSVEVGPYAIIGPNVEILQGTRIGSHTVIKGHTRIGENNNISSSVIVGEAPQHKHYQNEPTKLVIGDNNTIREFCTIHTGTVGGGGITKIGNNNFLMCYVHIAHDCMIGNDITFANSIALGGHVTVKHFATLGAFSIVHQFSVIGEYTMMGGATGVDRDVPPYVLAMGFRAEPRGINSIGIKRNNFSIEQLENIKNAYKIIYRSEIPYEDAKLQIIELAKSQKELIAFTEFFKQSSRGIIR
jgi:UDP-N-acetylglucosamine acyltransferase